MTTNKSVAHYTVNNLEADLIRFNSILEKSNHNFRLSLDGAYGQTFVNLATPEQIKNSCCEKLLCSGKPRHCKEKIESYIVDILSSSAK